MQDEEEILGAGGCWYISQAQIWIGYIELVDEWMICIWFSSWIISFLSNWSRPGHQQRQYCLPMVLDSLLSLHLFIAYHVNRGVQKFLLSQPRQCSWAVLSAGGLISLSLPLLWSTFKPHHSSAEGTVQCATLSRGMGLDTVSKIMSKAMALPSYPMFLICIVILNIWIVLLNVSFNKYSFI